MKENIHLISVLLNQTTARDGGSAEYASLQGCNLLEQRRSSCPGAIFCKHEWEQAIGENVTRILETI